MTELRVPNIPAGTDTLSAALMYAEAGFYVLPARRGTKDPGSVVGRHWNDKSSRDPKVITAWFAGADHDIALHCGRSGAVVFDVDDPDKLPDLLAGYLLTEWTDDFLENIRRLDEGLCTRVPYQATRPDQPHRGHYVFAMSAGRSIGNSTGRLAGGWGEVRGLNGVIIAAPSSHKDGGRYRWVRTGPVPTLPDDIAQQLDDASPAADAATDAAVRAFIAEHTKASRPNVLAGLVSALRTKIEAHESRHQSAVSVLTSAFKEVRIGLYTPRAAIDAIWPMFLHAVTKPPSSGKQGPARSKDEAKDEFKGIVAWAVGQALAADRDEIRRRVNEKMPDLPPLQPQRRRSHQRSSSSWRSPAARYNAAVSWADVLMPHAWACRGDGDPDADGAVWLHPGATSTRSATIRGGRLYVYSAGTAFDVTEPGNPKGYSKFDAYSVLNHAGDTKAAARSLRGVLW